MKNELRSTMENSFYNALGLTIIDHRESLFKEITTDKIIMELKKLTKTLI